MSYDTPLSREYITYFSIVHCVSHLKVDIFTSKELSDGKNIFYEEVV